MKKYNSVLLALFFITASVYSQIIQLRSIDIGAQWKAGTAHLSFSPAYSGDTLKPFDGNQFNALEILRTDTLTVTVQFDSSVTIEKVKVFFWHSAQWAFESANSLNDLDTKSGTYSKLVDVRSANGFQLDSSAIVSKKASVLRLSIKNPSDSSIRLGELVLEGSVTFTKFVLLPQPIQMVPATSFQLQLKIQDAQGNIYPNFVKTSISWSSSDQSIASVDEFGKITAIAKGNCEISAQTLDAKLKGTAPLSVVQDFRAPKVKPMVQKVVLVLQDPTMPGGSKIHTMFGWRDPAVLAQSLVKHFTEATDSVINFKIVETIYASILFTRLNGNYLSATQYVSLLQEPGWKSLRNASDSGKIMFDYREFVKYYKFDERRNSGEIDEVWVYTGPFLGMWESQMLGPKAFWWNSSPIKDGTALTKNLSVMGLNYERGVDQGFHSFGHRMESAMIQAYFEATGLGWNPKRANPTAWDLFTRYDKEVPDGAHVGNIHFPPNGTSDYNYGNTTLVTSYAENWYRYPFLLNQNSKVNVQTWILQPGEPLAETNEHIGYLRWWYGHIPRYEGVSDGVLNNWWHYSLDYEAAVALAKITPSLGVFDHNKYSLPNSFDLGQNFPNPFNPSTTIQFTLSEPSRIVLKIYDSLGREISTLINEDLGRGPHAALWNASDKATGIYYYQLSTSEKTTTKKMALIK
jgi:hypothetical protein